MTSSQSESDLQAQLAATHARIAVLERRLADRVEEPPAADARKYRDFYDNSPDMYAVCWPAQDLILDCNETLARTLGYGREELIGQSSHMLFEPSSFASLAPLLTEYLASGQVQNLDVQLLGKDGSVLDVLMSATLESGAAGGPALSRVTFRDVTDRKRAERERAFLSAIVESSDDAIVGRTIEGTIVSWNAGAEKMFGYTASEAIGRHLKLLAAPGGEADVQSLIDEVAQGHPVQATEAQRRAKDGRIVDVSVTSFLVRDAHGAVAGAASIMRDIGERKRLESALAGSEQQLRYAFEATSDALWDWDIRSGTGTVNDQWYRLYGYEPGEVSAIFDIWSSLLHPDDAELVGRALADYLEGRRPDYRVEYRSLTRSGEVRWHQSVGKVVAWDAAGKPTRMVGTDADITELVQKRMQLEEANYLLRLAARVAEIGVWTWDFATGSVEWDERMHQLFEVPDEVRRNGQYLAFWSSRLHPDDREAAAAMLAAMQAEGGTNEQVYRIVLTGGRVRFVEVAGTVEGGHDGQPLRMVGVLRDITELKQAERLAQDTNAELERLVAARTAQLQTAVEELRRANAGKDAFMAAISHELRTPLMGVLSNSELLEQEVHGPLTPGQLRHVAAIRSSGERLLTTVNNVLMYASLVAGKTAVARYDCRAADLCTAAVQPFLQAAEQKGQRISRMVTPEDLIIESDAQGIINILKMLLDNAIKFTPYGGQIEVRIERSEDGLCISVTDTGIGMTQEEIDGLFRPFSQGDKTLARRFEGVGIGLAYVHKMVELLGGSVRVESAQGSGSCFSVILPASQV